MKKIGEFSCIRVLEYDFKNLTLKIRFQINFNGGTEPRLKCESIMGLQKRPLIYSNPLFQLLNDDLYFELGDTGLASDLKKFYDPFFPHYMNKNIYISIILFLLFYSSTIESSYTFGIWDVV